MKKFFLAAVAISAICSSCEATDENFLQEINNAKVNAQKTKDGESADYQTYKNTVTRFIYNNDRSYAENVKMFEQHVNQYLNDDRQANTYESINLNQLERLIQNNVNIIDELDYSTEFKEGLYNMVHKNSEDLLPLKDQKENNLRNTLFKIHKDNNGDDLLNGKRTIAFAYGAQSSFKQAVLYAGAIELKIKIN